MYTLTTSISVERFEESDFEKYIDRITEWLMEHKKEFIVDKEKDKWEIWEQAQEQFYFVEDLDTNFYEDELELWDSTKDRIYEQLDEERSNSVEEAFKEQFFDLLEKLQRDYEKKQLE